MRLLVVLLLGLSACGTWQYYTTEEERAEHYPVYGGSKVVLGGRLIDGLPHGTCSGFFYGLGLIDLPFSFAADTVLLPYSLPASIIRYREDKRKKAEEPEKLQDAPPAT